MGADKPARSRNMRANCALASSCSSISADRMSQAFNRLRAMVGLPKYSPPMARP